MADSPVVKYEQNFVDLFIRHIAAHSEIDFELIVQLVKLAFDDVRVEGLDDEIFQLSHIVNVQLLAEDIVRNGSAFSRQSDDA